jgi:large subunit ribosomal protein L23
MALFSRKTKKEAPKAKAEVVVTPVAVTSGVAQSVAHVLRAPRITEKASLGMESFVYVFDVAPDANKKQVAAAVTAVYKVKPRKVAIVNTPAKYVRNARTGKSGMKGGYKKAYVYLNKGETITIA